MVPGSVHIGTVYSDKGDGTLDGPQGAKVFYRRGVIVMEDENVASSSLFEDIFEFEASVRSTEMESVAVVSPTSLASSSNPTWNREDPLYVSKIGMYDAEGRLVATSSPSTPVRISDKTPISFLLRFDA
jgi:hypothetical protein